MRDDKLRETDLEDIEDWLVRVEKSFTIRLVDCSLVGASSWLSLYYGFWSVMVFTPFNAILFYTIEDIVRAKEIETA